MLNKLNIIDTIFTKNPWTNVYGLSRSFLAISLLITLFLTGHDYLFPEINGKLIKAPMVGVENISIFNLFKDNIIIAYIISILILIWVISGFLPQLSGVLHWWVSYSYITTGVIIEGGDQISEILTLMFIPVTIFDNRLNHWYEPKSNKKEFAKAFVWSIYFVLSIQISIFYFHAGVAKLNVTEWVNGTAVYYWFTHNFFGITENFKSIFIYLLSFKYIVVFITWGTMVFEIILFGWIFMQRNKWNWKILFISAVLFHVSIAFIHGLVSFMFTMIGVLIIYFFPKDIQLKLWK